MRGPDASGHPSGYGTLVLLWNAHPYRLVAKPPLQPATGDISCGERLLQLTNAQRFKDQ